MGGGGHVVEAAAGEALRREMVVDLRQAGQPGPAAAAGAIKARLAVFDPGDVPAQGRQQGGNIFPLPECGVAKTLRPLKPRRFHTHTVMCRMFAFCSIRPDGRSQLGKLCLMRGVHREGPLSLSEPRKSTRPRSAITPPPPSRRPVASQESQRPLPPATRSAHDLA